jgi:hypothetical protein
MIYKIKDKKSKRYADTGRAVARFKKRMQIYVHPHDTEARTFLIEFLEREGFKIYEGWNADRQGVIDSPLPVCVELESKEYRTMGNVTAAAAAASQHIIIGEGEFYVLYEIYGTEGEDGPDAITRGCKTVILE